MVLEAVHACNGTNPPIINPLVSPLGITTKINHVQICISWDSVYFARPNKSTFMVHNPLRGWLNERSELSIQRIDNARCSIDNKVANYLIDCLTVNILFLIKQYCLLSKILFGIFFGTIIPFGDNWRCFILKNKLLKR